MDDMCRHGTVLGEMKSPNLLEKKHAHLSDRLDDEGGRMQCDTHMESTKGSVLQSGVLTCAASFSKSVAKNRDLFTTTCVD